MDATFLQRLGNARVLCRLALRRGDPAAIWDDPADEALVLEFIKACATRCVSAEELLLIHPDDLQTLFNELRIDVQHRVIIRKYLTWPHIALLNIWAVVRACFAVVAAAATFTRLLVTRGGSAWRMVVAIGVGVGVGASLGGLQLHRSLHHAVATFADAAAKRVADSPLLATATATAGASSSDQQQQQLRRGTQPPHHSNDEFVCI